MLNGALTLFPIVLSNGLIALYCSHVAFIIWRYCVTLLLFAGYPPSILYLSHLLLASICLVCRCYLYFFWPYWITLKRIWGDIKLYSYKAIPWWGSWGKSLRSHCAFFSQYRGGRCLSSRTRQLCILFSKLYQIQAMRDFQSGMRKSSSLVVL